MHVLLPLSLGRSCLRSHALVPVLLGAVLASSCGGSSGGSGQSGIPGQELAKPGGGTFFVDENGSGGAPNLHLAQVVWGRLVDVHEVDASGARVEVPVFRDFVIEPTILSGGGYVLDRNLVTQRERLTIQARKTGGVDTTAFDDLLRAASNQLPQLAVKNINAAPPFTLVPRNACVVLRFDDCLDDDAAAATVLADTVEVFTGYPPVTPFSARVVFDPNHGAIVGPAFHSTRVLVDLTTSEAEANALPVAQEVNPVGLPPSLPTPPSSNVSVRIATRVDVGSGQFQVLTNLSGVPLDDQKNGPVDNTSPSVDIVRALRSGNSEDSINGGSNGFLLDLDRPRVVGGWPITISSATNDPTGDAGFDFLLDFAFTTTCLNAPAVGDVVTINGSFLEVTEATALVGVGATDLKARSAVFVGNSLTLQGGGLYQAPFLPSLLLERGCWLSFLPEAGDFPAAGVSTSAQVLLRFSEAMDPATLSPFRDFLVVKGSELTAATSHNLIVGDVVPNNDLSVFAFAPKLPLRHQLGDNDSRMHVELVEPRDLAGNSLRHDLPIVEFLIDPQEATQSNGAIVLRLDEEDEYGPAGGGPDDRNDLRGQFFFDNERGAIFPRQVALAGWPADRSNPIPNRMVQVTAVFPLPLNPLGAKMQTVWRYCDLGWRVRDETKYNLDVLGLNWAPSNGAVQSDFFELFEIRLGHSRWLPDEGAMGAFPTTGLPGTTPYEGNYLTGSNPRVVHSRTLGYFVNPSSRFNSTTNVVMMPYPLNEGSGLDITYTWRDTSITTVGADGGVAGTNGTPGVPTQIEIDAGIEPAGAANNLFPVRQVPTIGLPLLMEFSCFPSDSGLGTNNPALLTPVTPSPNFRAFSSGGFNSLGNASPVLPDSELIPKGGFNPFSTPPGAVTVPSDPGLTMGQLDTVVRVSRVHSAWLDSGIGGVTQWQSPVLEPAGSGQPTGTSVLLDFRSATGFSGAGQGATPYNAALLNAYGNPPAQLPAGSQFAPVTLSDWTSDITLHNGKIFLQVRITFVNNPSTGLNPELTAIAFPFAK